MSGRAKKPACQRERRNAHASRTMKEQCHNIGCKSARPTRSAEHLQKHIGGNVHHTPFFELSVWLTNLYA